MPVDAAAAARVQKAGSFLKWQDDSLWLLKQEVWLLVPPVAVRREVIEECLFTPRRSEQTTR